MRRVERRWDVVFTGYNAYLHYIDYQKVSKEEFSAYCKGLLKSRRTYRWEDMKEYLADNLGFWVHVPVSGQQEESLKSLLTQLLKCGIRQTRKRCIQTSTLSPLRCSRYSTM